MTPPPPKFGSRNLFNLSFLPWNNNNKSPLTPPPTVHRDLPDTPGGAEELQEKRYLLSEGHELLDRTKSMLEEYSYILGKEATKRLRKAAAKLTKNAPSKSKLPKKSLGDISGFHQNATELYQEVENILREFEQHPPHPDAAVDPHHPAPRSRSNSPAPLPRKEPSPKATFNPEMQPESKVNLSRKESTRRGVELRDEGRHAADLARHDSAKPSPPSKNRDPREEDLNRSTSRRDGRSRKYDRDDRQEVERYRKPDDPRRYDSRRYAADQYQSRYQDRSDPYRDREREYRQRYYDPRDYRRGYDDNYYNDYDRSRPRRQDRRRDERDDIPPTTPHDNNKVSSRRNEPPMRVVHEDSPLPGQAPPPADGVPFAPTYVDYPTDRRERERRERDRDREGGRGDRDRDRDRDRRDRDRPPRKPDDYYYYEKQRRREYERDDYYRNRGYDEYPRPRRYEDEYRPRDRDRDERYRDREPRPGRDDRDRDRDKDRGKDRGDRDRGGKDRGDRERDRDKERRERDGERERGDREKSHQPHTAPVVPPHEGSPPPSPTNGDPSGSKFQEVFTPDPRRSGALPQHPEAEEEGA